MQRPRPPPTACSTTPVRTAAPGRAFSSKRVSTRPSWSASRPPSRLSRSSTPPTSRARWARSISAQHHGTRYRLRARRGPGGFSGKRAGGAGVLVPAHGAGTGATRLAGRPRGDLRTGCGCAALRGRGRCHRHANDTPYGLSGSISTATSGEPRVARAVETGTISVNSNSSVRYWTPFGGFKRSGIGRELRARRPGGVHRAQERLCLDGRLRRARLEYQIPSEDDHAGKA